MELPYVNKSDSLWEKLAVETRPIVIYGTGNGADKIIDILEEYGAAPTAVFASDSFVRSREFRGMTVRSYADVTAEYGDDIVILLAFGSTLPEIAERCAELAKKHTLLIPEVPLYESELFTFDYCEAHRAEMSAVLDLLDDDGSRALYADMVLFRLTGKPEYLGRTEPFASSVASMPNADRIGCVIDAGAYTGDTASVFASLPNCRKVIALEPDPRTFAKLSAYAESETGCEIVPMNHAAYDSVCERTFESTGGRGAGAKGTGRRAKTTVVSCVTIDSAAGSEQVDLIKYDVEGDEYRALLGSAETVARCRPSLIVSLYHRTEDLFRLPLMVHEMLPDAKLRIRRVPCIPAWDLALYAIME